MPLVNHNINNLNGGVSQQPPEERYDNQVESMDNYMITVALGLRRRNPVDALGALAVNHKANTAIHSYARGDGVKQYGITLCDDGLHIYDPEDVGSFQKTVHNVGATPVITKWAGANWKKDVQFVTVGDTTWLLNKNMVVQGASIAESEIPHAFYWVKKSYSDGSIANTGSGGANHGHAYQIVLDDNKFNAVYPALAVWQAWGATDWERANNWGFSYVSGLTGFRDLDETKIAGLTFDDSILAATALGRYIDVHADYIARAEGSIVYIKRTDEAEFTFESGDSWGNQASVGWKSTVAKLADLPSSMDGFTEAEVGTIAIAGTDTDNFTNYYLGWRDGKWIEKAGVGMRYAFDNTTLLAKIVQVDDDTFEFGFVDDYQLADAPAVYTAPQKDLFVARWSSTWEERKKGDDDSNPIPSFDGRQIGSIFFHKNRLGFTSEDNVILSEAGGYYNFFATTAMEILDSDPIDAGIDSNTVSIVKNVTATAGALTLWSDGIQFLLSGGEILSPATTRISQTSSYAASNDIAPVVVDNEVLFFNRKNGWLEVMSYNPASLQADKSSAESISSHVPEYIPEDIDSVCVASAYNMVLLFSKVNPTKIWVYKYFIHNGERIISAWFEWTFAETIVDIEILNDKLFLLVGTNEVLTMDLRPKLLTDTFLDRGVTSYQSKVILSQYNVMTGQDTMTIRVPFYMKNIKVRKQGKVDFAIINKERNKETIVNDKHLGRKLVVGGNTDKVETGFVTSYDTGCQIDTISLEGRLQPKSQNV